MGHGPYCNVSALPRALFTNDGLKMLYSGRTCVSMMAGVVMDSFIVQIGQKGGWKGPSNHTLGRGKLNTGIAAICSPDGRHVSLFHLL